MRHKKAPGPIKKTRWFICLFIWWVVAVFFYLFLSAREGHMVGNVISSGLQTVQESARKAGLPLLERDIQALTHLAQDVAKAKGVLNVSIIDHKNKIIAFTDVERILPLPGASVHRQDGASYWTYALDGGLEVVCFAADINFADTKIGEVLMEKSADGSGRWRLVFFLSAMTSFLAIAFVLLVIDYRGVTPLKTAIGERLRSWTGLGAGLPDGREMICPLCGCRKPLTPTFLLQANLDRYPVLQSTSKDNGTAQMLFPAGIHLREISRRDEFGWLRRQIIHRCADIIKRLAGD